MYCLVNWRLFQYTLQWRHNERDGVSNHQPHDCLPNRLLRRRSKKTSKHRVTGLCVGNSPVTGEFPARRASNAENFSIWWHHRELQIRDQWSTRIPQPRRVKTAVGNGWIATGHGSKSIGLYSQTEIMCYWKYGWNDGHFVQGEMS